MIFLGLIIWWLGNIYNFCRDWRGLELDLFWGERLGFGMFEVLLLKNWLEILDRGIEDLCCGLCNEDLDELLYGDILWLVGGVIGLVFGEYWFKEFCWFGDVIRFWYIEWFLFGIFIYSCWWCGDVLGVLIW